MKDALKNGKISRLISESGYWGWSQEVHLLEYRGKSFVIRRCKTLKKAKRYENLSKKFGRFGFLPKFITRIKKDVFYEYIPGRDLRKKESKKIIFQIGKIAGQVHKFKSKGNINKRFNQYLKESTTGEFIKLKKQKPLISKKEATKIKILFNYLKKQSKPKIYLDLYDIYPDNFRLKKGKVYLVDLEAIDSRIRGIGIAKAFLKWFKTKRKREYFKNGYQSVNSMKFFTEEYEDFVYLCFIVREINNRCRIGKEFDPNQFDWLISSYKKRRKELDYLLKKYVFIFKK
jgi:hypothetical protein